MGAQCQSEHMTEKEGSIDLKSWADSIIAAWDPYMELTIAKGLTPDSLKPITRVMYASALIPGGKDELDISVFAVYMLTFYIKLSVQDISEKSPMPLSWSETRAITQNCSVNECVCYT